MVDIGLGFWYNPYMNKGMNNMTDLETNVQDLMAAFTAATIAAIGRLKPVEPTITPEVVTPTPLMEVGDIVIANWNITDTPGLNGLVVKILVFEGDQACVKDSGGTISVFNVKNLRPIPKDF